MKNTCIQNSTVLKKGGLTSWSWNKHVLLPSANHTYWLEQCCADKKNLRYRYFVHCSTCLTFMAITIQPIMAANNKILTTSNGKKSYWFFDHFQWYVRWTLTLPVNYWSGEIHIFWSLLKQIQDCSLTSVYYFISSNRIIISSMIISHACKILLVFACQFC